MQRGRRGERQNIPGYALTNTSLLKAWNLTHTYVHKQLEENVAHNAPMRVCAKAMRIRIK